MGICIIELLCCKHPFVLDLSTCILCSPMSVTIPDLEGEKPVTLVITTRAWMDKEKERAHEDSIMKTEQNVKTCPACKHLPTHLLPPPNIHTHSPHPPTRPLSNPPLPAFSLGHSGLGVTDLGSAVCHCRLNRQVRLSQVELNKEATRFHSLPMEKRE